MKLWILGVCAALIPVTLTACAAADTPVSSVSSRVTLTGKVMHHDGMISLHVPDKPHVIYQLLPLWNQNLDTKHGDLVRVYAERSDAENSDHLLKVRNLRVLQRSNVMETEREILQFSLAIDKATYRRGETINFTMTLRNNSDQPQQLTFYSGQTFDIMATPQGENEPIWRWAQGRMFTRAIREVAIQPGETLTFPAKWDQTTNAGEVAPRDEYTMRAELAAADRIPTTPVTIRLTD